MPSGFATGKVLVAAFRANEKFHLSPACSCTDLTIAEIKIRGRASQ